MGHGVSFCVVSNHYHLKPGRASGGEEGGGRPRRQSFKGTRIQWRKRGEEEGGTGCFSFATCREEEGGERQKALPRSHVCVAIALVPALLPLLLSRVRRRLWKCVSSCLPSSFWRNRYKRNAAWEEEKRRERVFPGILLLLLASSTHDSQKRWEGAFLACPHSHRGSASRRRRKRKFFTNVWEEEALRMGRGGRRGRSSSAMKIPLRMPSPPLLRRLQSRGSTKEGEGFNE